MKTTYAKNLDWPLLLSVCMLMGIGLLALYSYFPPQDLFNNPLGSTFFKQVLFAGAAAGLMVMGLMLDYTMLRRVAYLLFLGCLAALLALLVMGRFTRGSRGWFMLGPFMVQPAEFMKIAMVLALARYLMYAKKLQQKRGLILPILMTAVPTGLVLIQPDLGTALLFFPALFAMLFAAGARPRHLAVLLLVGMVAAPFAYHFGLKQYQKYRLISFLAPEDVPKKYSYQGRQSVRAVAAGMITGQGVGEAAVSYTFYVPDRHTDFVFSIIAQDLGFVGCTFLILLFAVFFTRSMGIAHNSREPFGRLAVVGLTTIVALQTFINIGMAVGVAPITGLTLPFVSYGGSSMLTCALTATIILNVGARWVPTFSSREMGSGPVLITEFNPANRFPV